LALSAVGFFKEEKLTIVFVFFGIAPSVLNREYEGNRRVHDVMVLSWSRIRVANIRKKERKEKKKAPGDDVGFVSLVTIWDDGL